MKMETSFYHDQGNSSVKQMKQKMTLDFDSQSATKKQKSVAVGLLASPDLHMLKLASPELERMIINHNGMVTTTPTPTQFLCPKYVTEEQDAYARGFVDALAELYNKEAGLPATEARDMAQSQVNSTMNGLNPSGLTTVNNVDMDLSSLMPTSAASVLTTLQPVQQQQVAPVVSLQNQEAPTTLTTVPTIIPTSSVFTTAITTDIETSQHAVVPMSTIAMDTNSMDIIPVKEEPQTVPSLGLTPPISPINMENQERIKLDRKRERNRVAARKCRTRKLERISRLEDRVNALKAENVGLSTTATSLRNQVAKLKSQIMTHVNSGCKVMVSPNLL